MHRTTLARTQRRTRSARCATTTCTLRTRTLENWLTGNGASWRGPPLWRTRGAHVRRTRRWRTNWRCVHRTWSGLRNDKSARRYVLDRLRGMYRMRGSRCVRRCRWLNRWRWNFRFGGNLLDRFFDGCRSRGCLRRHYDTWSLTRLWSNQSRCSSWRSWSRGQFWFGLTLRRRDGLFYLGLVNRGSSNWRGRSRRHFWGRRHFRRGCCRFGRSNWSRGRGSRFCHHGGRRCRLRRNRCCRFRWSRRSRLLQNCL